MAPVRTLIVDDHADVRFLIRTIIGDVGGELEVAGEADGVDAALALLDVVAPDVVVLDARMPRVDGFQAAVLLRERRPGLPIVLCSAWVDDAVRARAAATGIDEVLCKDRFEDLPDLLLALARRG